MIAFPSTRWSLIHASDLANGQIADVWHQLFETYQPVIVGYFRRRGLPADADDLAQEFFERSMSQGWWSRADETLGSFRQFLHVLLKRFAVHHERYGHRRWEITQAATDDDHAVGSPDRQFDLDFAVCMTNQAIVRLRNDYSRDNRIEIFDALVPFITETPQTGDLAKLSSTLNVAPNTLSVQLRRLRIRLQKTIRGMLLQLSADDVQAELDFDALRHVLDEGAQ